MAETGAKIGKRTTFKRETPLDSGNFVAVCEVKSINGPGLNREEADATNFDSPDDLEEMIASIKKAPEVSLGLNFRPDHGTQGNTTGLFKLYDDGTTERWRIEFPQFPGSPTITFKGYLTSLEPVSTTKEIVSLAAKIRVTSKPVLVNFG